MKMVTTSHIGLGSFSLFFLCIMSEMALSKNFGNGQEYLN